MREIRLSGLMRGARQYLASTLPATRSEEYKDRMGDGLIKCPDDRWNKAGMKDLPDWNAARLRYQTTTFGLEFRSRA